MCNSARYRRLSSEDFDAVHSVCERFEQAWLSGKRPSIESFLTEAPAAIRDALFDELLAIELERRVAANDTPTVRALSERFPERSASIRRAVHELAGDTRIPTKAQSPLSATNADFSESDIEQPGTVIGPYELEAVIGVGGMGSVWRARQRQPVSREVALKLIKVGMDTRQVVARFEAERQALAMMDHPNIARVLDAGSTNLGRPYFVMELVQGQKITTYCDLKQLAIDERLGLFAVVCDAVQHAHAKGVIHRDIKPSNVLVTESAGVPTPKVIDFGLAKATREKLTDLTVVTAVGQFMGTPDSMSPEQATLSNQDIDTRTDVYSLGTLLYELLVGVTPFDFTSLGDRTHDVLLRTIREDEPPRMSVRLASLGDSAPEIAERRRVGTQNLRYLLRGDLEVIVHKALEKDRSRRYQTPLELAADIERFRSSEPIEARPSSVFYRLQKTAARNRVAVLFVTTLALTLLTGLAVSTFLAIRAMNAEGDLAEQLGIAEERTELERWERYRSTMGAVGNAMHGEEDVQLARRNLDSAPDEYRGWEWSYFDSLLQDESQSVADFGTNDLWYCPVFAVHPSRWQVAVHQPTGEMAFWNPRVRQDFGGADYAAAAAAAITYSHDGRLVAVAGDDHAVHVWNVETGELICQLVGHQSSVLHLAFHPDLSQLASGGFDHWVAVWDIASGEAVLKRETSSQCMELAYSTDGSRLMICSGKDVIAIDTESSTTATEFSGAATNITVAGLSNDGKLLTCGTSHPANQVLVWDLESGKLLAEMTGHTNQVSGVAFNADGSRIASVSLDQTLRLWDVVSGEVVHVFSGHTAPVFSVAFSPNGAQIATGSRDETVRLWDSDTGSELEVFRGHGAEVAQVAYSPDGSRVVSASFDGTLRTWDSRLEKTDVLRGHTGFVYDVAFGPFANKVFSVAWDGRLFEWDLDRGRPSRALSHPADVITSVAIDPTGLHVVTLSRRTNTDREGRLLMLWDRKSGALLHTIPITGPNWLESRATISHPNLLGEEGGNLLAAGDDAGRVYLFDAKTGDERTILKGHQRGILDLAFRPTSEVSTRAAAHLATSSEDLTVRIWDVANESLVTTLRGHKSHIHRVVYSLDGSLLATASSDKTVRLWDCSNYELLGELPHGSIVYGLAFSPDGTRLATGCADRTIRLWDLTRQQEVANLRGHKQYVHAVSFSADGSRLASASGDGTVRIWDSLTRSKRGSPAKITSHRGSVGLAFRSLGHRRLLQGGNVQRGRPRPRQLRNEDPWRARRTRRPLHERDAIPGTGGAGRTPPA